MFNLVRVPYLLLYAVKRYDSVKERAISLLRLPLLQMGFPPDWSKIEDLEWSKFQASVVQGQVL